MARPVDGNTASAFAKVRVAPESRLDCRAPSELGLAPKYFPYHVWVSVGSGVRKWIYLNSSGAYIELS